MTDQNQTGGPRRLSDEELMRAVPRETGGKQARVGIFVILGLLSFIVVLFWMTDPATFRGRYKIVTQVGNAGGVRAGDPVQMYGINLGRVSGFEITAPGVVNITMEIEGEWAIPEDSYATFGSAGIFGGRTIVIEPGDAQNMLEAWDTIPGIAPGGSGLLGSVDEMSEQAETVLDRITALLEPETVGSVQESVQELEQLLRELSGIAAEQRSELSQLTQSLAVTAENLEDATEGPELERAIARADSAMSVLTDTGRSLDAASASLREVLGRIERGEGTLGRLSTDEMLYANLNQAAESLNALLLDIQANPRRYISLSLF